MEFLLIIGGVVFVMLLLNKVQGLNLVGERKVETRPTGKTFTHTAVITGRGDYDFNIVGESHYQEALNVICGGKRKGGHQKKVTAKLFPEDDNPYDNQAVCVQIEQRTVGYLSRENARWLRQQFNHPNLCWRVAALVVGGWQSEQGEGHYGVKLDIPTGEKES